MKAFARLLVPILLLFVSPAIADERDNGNAKPVVAAQSGAPAKMSAAVKACLQSDCKSGHGSAVYLGNGYFITAQHVATESAKWVLRAEDKRLIYANTVWTLASDDLALLKIDEKRHKTGIDFPVAKLACREPYVAEKLVGVGNPSMIMFAHVNGYITAGAQEIGGTTQFYRPEAPAHDTLNVSVGGAELTFDPASRKKAAAQDIGYWRAAYVLEMAVAPGFSGGPIFTQKGEVIGLLVGVLNGTSYAVMEPTNKLCGLLPPLESEAAE
jgi:S1-C subfamily serine protease